MAKFVFLVLIAGSACSLASAARIKRNRPSTQTTEGEGSHNETKLARVFGPGGAKYTDIAQGELGTCYFLAAIASIAQKHKDLIEGMFVNRELWNAPTPVYTTQWLLNGRQTKVSVDGMIPTSPESGAPYFVNINDGADFWPVILEKSWAKIFGSFKSVSGGHAADAFKAITQAPVDTYDLKEKKVDADTVWLKLEEADASKFPAVGSVDEPNSYNLPYPHALSVLEVSDDYEGHGKAVRINNPWGTKNKYCGRIPNPDHEQGSYWLGFDEFMDAFSSMTIAKVREGYHVSAEPIRTTGRNQPTTTALLEFTMQGDEPFAVQLEWPSPRYTPDCAILSPVFEMGVAKDGDFENAVFAKKSHWLMSNARADLRGAGTYTVFVNAVFQKGSLLKEIVVNTYAAENVALVQQRSQDPWDVFSRMKGLCKSIAVKGAGKYVGKDGNFILSDKLVNGFPYFVPADRLGHPQYKVIYYTPATTTITGTAKGYSMTGTSARGWQVIDTTSQAEEGLSYTGVLEKGVRCTASSLLQSDDEELSGLELVEVDLNRAVAERAVTEYQYASLQVDGSRVDDAQDSHAQCDAKIARLPELDNAASITRSRGDPMFPAALASISAQGETCGDAARAEEQSCAKYDHWQTISQISEGMQAREAQKTESTRRVRECLSGASVSGKCSIDNNCRSGDTIVMTALAKSVNTRVTLTMGPRTHGEFEMLYCEALHGLTGQVSGYTPPGKKDVCGGGAASVSKCVEGRVTGDSCYVENTCTAHVVLKGLAKAYNTNVKLDLPSKSSGTVEKMYCDVLRDQGGKVVAR